MRLFMTVDAVGGVWTYALDLARGLAARGDAVTLALLGPAPSPAQRAEVAAVGGLRLIETGLPLDWTAESPSVLTAAAHDVARLARAERAQVVQLNSPALAAEARFEAPVVGVAHSCLATWWAAVKGREPQPRAFRWRIEATAAGYRACDAVIAPSAAFAAATEAACGVAPIVVRNGRALLGGSAAPTRDVPVLTAGRLWDEGKGAATLDAAAALLEVPVLAVGPTCGPNGEVVAAPRLQLRGAVDGEVLAGWLGRTRVFVSAAVYEPFGLAVLEAAQAGCALALSDIPTFRELWDGAAVFFPPGDSQGLAEAVRTVLADDVLAERLSTAARIRAERYDAARFVGEMAALYRALLRPQARAAAGAAA